MTHQMLLALSRVGVLQQSHRASHHQILRINRVVTLLSIPVFNRQYSLVRSPRRSRRILPAVSRRSLLLHNRQFNRVEILQQSLHNNQLYNPAVIQRRHRVVTPPLCRPHNRLFNRRMILRRSHLVNLFRTPPMFRVIIRRCNLAPCQVLFPQRNHQRSQQDLLRIVRRSNRPPSPPPSHFVAHLVSR